MEKAKAAVGNFLSKDGKHDTTVHETVNPAVTHETIKPTHHEHVEKAVDREVHQHHHHTTVQPVTHQEVLPEKHTHNLVGTEHREIHHGNDDHVQQRLQAERAQFKHHKETGEVRHTTSEAPVVTGEHVHHHVHENIQPVVQKETIQPSVVHTTIPVHEVHHNEAKHHTATTLPAVSMGEFQKQGGALGGRDERTDRFEGQPRAVGDTLSGGNHNSTIGGPGAAGTTSLTDKNGRTGQSGTLRDNTTGTGAGMTGTGATGTGVGHHHGTTGTTGTTGTGYGTTGTTGTTTGGKLPEGSAGPHNSRLGNAADPRVDSDLDSTGAGTGVGSTGRTGATGTRSTTGATGTTGTTGTTTGTTGTTGTTTTKKPSLLDKLNPTKDADGDGKAGFMK